VKVDRRIQKTRDALRRALSELITEKSYDDITVHELTDRANVSRSSFYVHFRDKDDLLISGFEEIGVSSSDDLFETSSDGSTYPNFSIVLFRGSEHWKDMARACLCGEPGNAAAYHMRNLLVIKTREWLKKTRPGLSQADLESTVHYLSSALQGLLTWWVNNDFIYPAEEISDRFNRLATVGLEGILQDRKQPGRPDPAA
jgi:AcrR family transcriptional regulator